jgi:hypothetical protein
MLSIVAIHINQKLRILYMTQRQSLCPLDNNRFKSSKLCDTSRLIEIDWRLDWLLMGRLVGFCISCISETIATNTVSRENLSNDSDGVSSLTM